MSGAATGLAGLEALANDTAAYTFLVQQMLAQANHVSLVKVLAVTPAGVGAGTGSVSVQPMVHQADGAGGNLTPHGTVNNLAYSRLQGGVNAVIMDPVVGDIGVAVFCDRDISNVKKTRQPAPPGSMRRFDWADGIYLPALLNGTPTQYVIFKPGTDGIEIVSPNKVTLTTPTVVMSGDLHVEGAVIAGFGGGDQIGLQSHTHPDPQGGNTLPPNPGT